jgi:hypothetical protein
VYSPASALAQPIGPSAWPTRTAPGVVPRSSSSPSRRRRSRRGRHRRHAVTVAVAAIAAVDVHTATAAHEVLPYRLGKELSERFWQMSADELERTYIPSRMTRPVKKKVQRSADKRSAREILSADCSPSIGCGTKSEPADARPASLTAMELIQCSIW